MKKSIIAAIVLMVAMTGQTYATTYNTSDYVGKSLTLHQTGDVIVVDSSEKINNIYASSCVFTLVFDDTYVLSVKNDSEFEGCTLNITSTASAAQHWIDSFAQDGGGMVTLAPKFNQLGPGPVSIEGIAVGNTVTLVGTSQKASFTYVGRKTGLDEIQEGEIAWLNKYNTTSLNLIAKLNGAPIPVPEPTTGTLGLLALSALAARRRRK